MPKTISQLLLSHWQNTQVEDCYEPSQCKFLHYVTVTKKTGIVIVYLYGVCPPSENQENGSACLSHGPNWITESQREEEKKKVNFWAKLLL